MERKTAIILATVALFCVIAVAFAAQWYFSEPQSVTVTDYIVTMDTLPSTVINGTMSITGNVTLSGNPVPLTSVTLFVNGVETGYTTFTETDGTYVIVYDVAEQPGTVLTFKVGTYH